MVLLPRNQGSTLDVEDVDAPNAVVTYNVWGEYRLIVISPD